MNDQSVDLLTVLPPLFDRVRGRSSTTLSTESAAPALLRPHRTCLDMKYSRVILPP